jgi:hypothetical protein
MFVSVVDVPVLVTLGVLSAVLFRNWLCRRSENWYLFLTLLSVGLVWTVVALANLTPTAYWALGAPVTRLPDGIGWVYVLSYPLWYRAAAEATFVLVGRRPVEGGLLWIFRLADRTEPLRPSWRSTRVDDDE